MIPKKNAGPSRSTGARLGESLRAHGLRLTGPRRAILEVVCATDVHPSASFVYAQVRRRLPRVSLGTVYRNLRRLAAAGLLQGTGTTPSHPIQILADAYGLDGTP